MEVGLFVPEGTNVDIIREEYPDLNEDEGWGEGFQHYYCGHSMDEDDSLGEEWMTYDECVEFCGFCNGALESSECMIEGNGGWAQDMISRTDFSTLAVTDEEKHEYERTSKLYWAACVRGEKASQAKSNPKLSSNP